MELSILYDTDEGRKSYAVTAVVPQGSVKGPILWNVMYDGVLRRICGRYSPRGDGKYFEELEQTCNAAVNRVRSWIASIGLNWVIKTDEVLT